MSTQSLPRPKKSAGSRSKQKKSAPARRPVAPSPWVAWWPLLAGIVVTFATVKTAEILPLMGPGGLLKLKLLYPFAMLLKQAPLPLSEQSAEQWSQILIYAQWALYGLYASLAIRWTSRWRAPSADQRSTPRSLRFAMGPLSPLTTAPVEIVECPRDAWQAMPRQIPTEIKAAYLRALIDAGFRHIDAVSFVSPAAVPQMADAERVLAALQPAAPVEIIGIVVNRRGAERAAACSGVATLGFPCSVSASFLARNQQQTVEQMWQALQAVAGCAAAARLKLTVYVSMAFGNPYQEPWSGLSVLSLCRSLVDRGVTTISLADTIGVADPEQIYALFSLLHAELPGISFGAHLHARQDQAGARLVAAYRAGCRRFDMTMRGQGGCPFAQDALVGNVATETALEQLREVGAVLPELHSLDPLLNMSNNIAHEFGAGFEAQPLCPASDLASPGV